ncbi:hypothetical protein HYZ80_00335 [Candidatus Parcubacteria bacterium]|nr:hypothetical protein [Candidatus Parcubacteria bacterium]
MGIELAEKEVLDFFFEAGMEICADDIVMAKRTIVELPGSRVLRYKKPPFLYVDCYFSVGEKSFGQTGIWHEELRSGPVWGMQYRGWCKDKRAIPFLRRALRYAYENRIFVGGRGPKSFRVEDETLSYLNGLLTLNRPHSFSDCEGTEGIFDLAAKGEAPSHLFHHGYNCLALVHLS